MSRIGKLPVAIPDKVKVAVEDGNLVKVEGPKGKLEQVFDAPVSITVEDGEVKVSPKNETRHARAMYGTTRSIIANMVQGVVEGYEKNLEVKGVGFRAAVKGSQLDLSLGYSHPILYDIPEGITVTVADNTKIKVQGASKAVVGKVAAELKHFYKPEPYKGKGVHIQGERYITKEGKKAG